MSTLILENIKHPDASGNALELSADGNLTSPNYLFATGGANFGSTIDTNGIFDTNGITTSGYGVSGLIIDTDQADSNVSSRLILKNGTNAGSAYYSTGGWVFNTGASLGATSGTPRLNITTDGYITTPAQPHWMGSVTESSDQSNSYANTFVPHPSFSRNTLTPSNSRITVPIAGVYMITFQTISDRLSGRYDARIYVNGNSISSALTEYSSTDGYKQRTLTVSVYLQANDYIQFYNQNWYDYTNTSYTDWRTASVTLLG